LHDNGIHLIDLTRYFLGEVEEVKGFASGGVWHFDGCEDNGFALLRSAEGKVATVHASWTEWGKYQFRIELVGTRGRIVATCFPMRLEALWSDSVAGPMRRTRQRFATVQAGEHLRSYRWVVLKSFALEIDAFVRRLRGDRTELATGFDGLRAIEIAWSASNREDAGSAGVAGLRIATPSTDEAMDLRIER
ncbi:MAG: Gfo/Idh/MocA family protein, partial [Longimicrobiales bacterium]